MIAELRIERATAADLATLVRHNRGLAMETEALALDEAVVTAGVRAALADEQKAFYLIARSASSEPAGSLMVTREWSDWRDGWIWWIQSVYVPVAWRRRGVYRRLHDAVRARARAAGDVRAIRLYVDADNDRAQRTYDAVGMTPSRYRLFEEPVSG